MHLRKLISDFHITSNLFFECLGCSSGFLELQLQLKICKVTIIHVFYLKLLHQRQTSSLILLLMFVSFESELPLLVLALLYKGNFSNPTHSKNCYNSTTVFKVTYSRGSLVFIIAIIISISCNSRICLFVNCTV